MMTTRTDVFRMPRQDERFTDRLLLVIDALAEFCIPIMLGAAIGWLLGLYLGRAYVEHYQPVHLSQFDSWTEISEWSFRPFSIAIVGGYAGVAIGAVTAVVLRLRSYFRE